MDGIAPFIPSPVKFSDFRSSGHDNAGQGTRSVFLSVSAIIHPSSDDAVASSLIEGLVFVSVKHAPSYYNPFSVVLCYLKVRCIPSLLWYKFNETVVNPLFRSKFKDIITFD